MTMTTDEFIHRRLEAAGYDLRPVAYHRMMFLGPTTYNALTSAIQRASDEKVITL